MAPNAVEVMHRAVTVSDVQCVRHSDCGVDIAFGVSNSLPNWHSLREESSDGGVTWQARPGLPAGVVVLSLTLSADGHTIYALTSAGEVYEAQKGVWYLLSSGLQLAAPAA